MFGVLGFFFFKIWQILFCLYLGTSLWIFLVTIYACETLLIFFQCYVLYSIQPNIMESSFCFHFCDCSTKINTKYHNCQKDRYPRKIRMRKQTALVIRPHVPLSHCNKHRCIYQILSSLMHTPSSAFKFQADKSSGSNRPFLRLAILRLATPDMKLYCAVYEIYSLAGNLESLQEMNLGQILCLFLNI